MTVITKESYPALFETILYGYYDKGLVNRLEPEPATINSMFSSAVVGCAETELKKLTANQRQEFACGEYSDIQDMIASFGLKQADRVLQEIFD